MEDASRILGNLFSNPVDPMHDAIPPPASDRRCRVLSLAHSAFFTGFGEEDRILPSHLLAVAAGTLDPVLTMFGHVQGKRENSLTFLPAKRDAENIITSSSRRITLVP